MNVCQPGVATVGAVGGGFLMVKGAHLESGYFAGWTTPFAVLLGLFRPGNVRIPGSHLSDGSAAVRTSMQ